MSHFDFLDLVETRFKQDLGCKWKTPSQPNHYDSFLHLLQNRSRSHHLETREFLAQTSKIVRRNGKNLLCQLKSHGFGRVHNISANREEQAFKRLQELAVCYRAFRQERKLKKQAILQQLRQILREDGCAIDRKGHVQDMLLLKGHDDLEEQLSEDEPDGFAHGEKDFEDSGNEFGSEEGEEVKRGYRSKQRSQSEKTLKRSCKRERKRSTSSDKSLGVTVNNHPVNKLFKK